VVRNGIEISFKLKKNMGKLSLIILFCVIHFNFTMLCDKIYFTETSLEYAVQKAKEADKFVFIFLFESGEQKADFFQSAVFYKSTICSFFNKEFINIKARSDSEMGQLLIKEHQINSTPCFLFFDKDGSLRSQTSNIRGTKDLFLHAKQQLE